MKKLLFTISALIVLTGCQNNQVEINTTYNEPLVGGVGDLSYGDVYEFDSGEPRSVSIATLDENRFVVCIADYAGSGTSEGQCYVGSVSGTAISYGNASLYAANSYVLTEETPCSVIKIGTDKIAVAYTDDTLDDGYARVGTTTGTAINGWGTATQFDTGNVEWISAVAIGEDKFVICYNDETDSDTGKCIVASVSGTTISYGAETDFSVNDNYAKEINTVQLGTDKFASCFLAEDYDSVRCYTAAVSGTSINFGEALYLESGDVNSGFYNIGLDSYEDDKFLASFREYTSAGEAIVATTISTTTATAGSDYSFKTPSASSFVAMTGANNAVILYATSSSNTSNLSSKYATIDWGDKSITYGNEFIVEADLINDRYTDVSFLGAGKYVVCYQNYSDNRDGECRIGSVGAESGEPTVNTCNYSGTGDWNVNYSDNCTASTTTWVKGNCNFNYDGAGSFSLRSLIQCDNINAGNGFKIDVENASGKIEIY